MLRRKASFGGHRYIVKKHKPDGRVTRVDLSSIVHGERNSSNAAPTPQILYDVPPTAHASEQEPPLPPTSSAYHAAKSAQLIAWEQLRSSMTRAAFDCSRPPVQYCRLCSCEKLPVVRCNDCGPEYLVCVECADRDHKLRPLHSMLVWTDNMFERFEPRGIKSLKRLDHEDCSTMYVRKVTIVNHAGIAHDVMCCFCACEPMPCTLRRFGLWAATPSEVRCAFSLDFLRWLEAVVVTGHMSVHAFVEAVRFKNGHQLKDVSWLYRLLLEEGFAEYRFHAFQLRTLSNSLTGNNNDICCPACAHTKQDVGPLIASLDGNFGLVRRGKAGQMATKPKHDDTVFLSDTVAQSFVSSYGNADKKSEQICSNFAADSVVHSASQQRKLDVTGVFGAVCKHGIPLKFVNMRHGERLAYPVHLVQELLPSYHTVNRKYLMYDIACSLDQHISKMRTIGGSAAEIVEIFRNVKLSVPVFHCYGHIASCQRKYNPRRVSGIGRVDGECVERFWSFARHFAMMTKDMTSAHRIDLLTEAFYYYAERKKESLGDSLIKSYKATIQDMTSAEEELRNLSKTHNLNIHDDDTFLQWDQLETANITHTKHHLNRTSGKAQRLLYKMFSLARDRQFHLETKRKHAVGQAACKRVSQQINQCSSALRRLLHEFNELSSVPTSSVTQTLSEKDVFDPTSTVYVTLQTASDTQIDHTVRREALELWHRKRRAAEELELCVGDMFNTYCHYLRLFTGLVDSVKSEKDVGKRAVLYELGVRTQHRCEELYTSFKPYNTVLPEVELFFQTRVPAHEGQSGGINFESDSESIEVSGCDMDSEDDTDVYSDSSVEQEDIC